MLAGSATSHVTLRTRPKLSRLLTAVAKASASISASMTLCPPAPNRFAVLVTSTVSGTVLCLCYSTHRKACDRANAMERQMKKRLYPAVLERGSKGTFGAWFPDFPDCVAGGRTQEETLEKAENNLVQAIDEHGGPLPEPTPI